MTSGGVEVVLLDWMNEYGWDCDVMSFRRTKALEVIGEIAR
jgi:hypothetical protein